MRLTDLDKGESARIIKIYAQRELKQRLISFGIMKEATVEVLATAPAKSTMEVRVGKMRIALRNEEAKMIEVERI